jgi:hypothetical protein
MVFIIGTQRSGSNLLRLMLNQSPELAAPHPPHILHIFFPLLYLYGDLEKEENFARLVADVCEFVAKNPVEWESVPNAADILAKCKQKTLIEIMVQVYAQAAAAKGAKDWCCKSMANVAFLSDLEKELPEAKYIYLYRDGRDVAVSFSKAYVGEKHFYSIAKQWTSDQKLSLSHQKRISDNRFFPLKYEDFIQFPAEKLRELCAFLEIEFLPEMLQYYNSNESKRTAESGAMWKNVVKPVLSNNKQKFLREATLDQIRIFETVAAKELSDLGYELKTKEEERRAFSEDNIVQFEAENRFLKEEIHQKLGAEELEKRKAQAALLARIKAK